MNPSRADPAGQGARPKLPLVEAPLRIAPGRLRLWAAGLFLIGLAPIVAAPFYGFHDWPAFWSAGAVLGTSDLTDGNRLLAWQAGHGLPLAVFPYLPASALLLWPLAQLPMALGFWLWAAAMLGCSLLAARSASRAFGLSVPMAVGTTIAWAPLTGAIVIGQNTPVALLLATIAIEALAAGRSRGAGIAAGLLLYKPTLGLPLVGLLALRARWRGLAVVVVMAVAWYLGGMMASGGDVAWPRTWLGTVLGYMGQDAAVNADKAVSLPGLLARLPIPTVVAVLGGLVIVLLAIPRLVNAPVVEAAAGACLVGVAASPHAWGYDAVLILPIIWWALAGGIAEPWRTRLIVTGYALAPFWLISRQTQLSMLAPVVLGAAAIWLTGAWRAGSAGADGPGAGALRAAGVVRRA